MSITADTELPEQTIRDKLEQRQRELEMAYGLDIEPNRHFRRPAERPFVHDQERYATVEEQRQQTTLLFGGLTRKHEHLLEGAVKGLGYRCQALPTPDLQAFTLGKEYGNNGFCNPAYFTGGNLIKYLQGLEAKGINRQEIIDKYVFVTAGYCGPCRFGLYEGELRLVLRNYGFDGLRVMLIKIAGGINQAEAELVVDMNVDFFLAILNAIIMGDVLYQLGFQIRPYELEPERTDRVMEEALADLYDALRDKDSYKLPAGWKRLLSGTKLEKKVTLIAKFLHVLRTPYFPEALSRARDRFNGIEIDRFRVRPVVKIIGEFSAAIGEGDINFNMFRFLEQEGAEVLVDPVVSTQLMRWLHLHKHRLKDKKGLYEDRQVPAAWRLDRRLKDSLTHYKKIGLLTLVEKLFGGQISRYQEALGGTVEEISDINELAVLAEPFYNWRCGAGEAHLEVAQNIYYHTHNLCHMALSLKPFGCLPSTQSDGAQVAAVEQYPNSIFLSVETAGEGEVLAHSRVQMVLDTAQEKAQQEFDEALARSGHSLDELMRYVDDHPELKRPMYHVPHRERVVGRAAQFVLHAADLMDGRVQSTA